MAKHTGRLSPRQKMINLMYIVLTAMLALNVSSDVLDGFTQVEEGLSRSNVTLSLRNDAIMERLRAFAAQNPEKGGMWLDKAEVVKAETERLLKEVDALKLEIVRMSDGEDGDPENIRRTDNLESAGDVMLNPTSKKGEKLRGRIDDYRNFILGYVADSAKRTGIEVALSTEPSKSKGSDVERRWEVARFEKQPVVAAITLLTKLQTDIRFAEGEALANLLGNVDAGDLRVNEINAFVIPQSRLVMRGDKYSANIILAAVDTTSRPSIYVNGAKLSSTDGKYEFVASSTGNYDYSGYLEVAHDDGSITKHPFRSEYAVIEPTATVSATMMNVLYAGIDNPVSISVPGVDRSSVTATMTNGTLTRQGDHWIARPSAVGQDAVISVSASGTGGGTHHAGSMTYKVRRLPDPTAYVRSGDDGSVRYRGQRPIAKNQLLASPGIGASIDDGILDIDFRITGFETVFIDQMGNSIPEKSDGAKFSSRQIEKIRRLARGKRFYISRIRAVGPDGAERSLSPIEVTVN